jgi:hypothetical protein
MKIESTPASQGVTYNAKFEINLDLTGLITLIRFMLSLNLSGLILKSGIRN